MARTKMCLGWAIAIGVLVSIYGCGPVTETGEPSEAERNASEQQSESEALLAPPILMAAHGAVMLPDRTFAEPTLGLALSAQPYYMARLLKEADKATRKAFDEVRRNVATELAAGGEEQVAANAALIEWLIERVRPADKVQLLSINGALARKARHNPVTLAETLDNEGIGVARQAFTTTTDLGEQPYIDACRAAGVPTPPNWGTTGPTGWTKQGRVTPDFLKFTAFADVYTFESTVPGQRGLCMALPRYEEGLFGNSISFLGIICQGNDTSKACFWDLRFDLDIVEGESHPIVGDVFVGGGDLLMLGSGVCTDCHAGENAFIVHPKSKLNRGAPLYANSWVNPLVHPWFPQNRRPGRDLELTAVPSDHRSCLTCHNKSSHTRFPRLKGDLMGYCVTIAANALIPMTGTMPDPIPPQTKNDPGLYKAHADVMKAMAGWPSSPGCGATSISTRYGGRYQANDSFSSTNAESVGIGDFDNDGKADLVKFVFGSAADVFVSKSNGATFAAPVKWHDNFAGNRHGVGVGDFDGDGRDDIMYVFNSDNVFKVALAQAEGGFGPAATWWNGSAPVFGSHLVGDVNNDGKDDVILLFGRTVASATSTEVWVALSTGTGFSNPTKFAGGFADANATYGVGDVNGDGFEDIVKFTQGTTADVFVLLSKGTGFESAKKWHESFAGGMDMPRVGDVTGDGIDDIITFSRAGTGDVYVAASTGSSFGDPVLWHPFFASGSPVVFIGDMDADYDAEAIAVYQDSTADVYALTALP